ncbi:probable RNA methyltransferase CG11342 [Pectinophora gossypiella]|uniref:probable RNA methyltransferase CG11342 n=1 Tax=Pectinophora gossypiella TaxID=13191 RepID=UPI00214EE9D6|nr:probable RNA methyltransferase CG11342 [Pectinophora gossypiella]XP_049865174.1 probable RNA methyltransferase CG11342 [Pectinophora gossypiella]
MTTEDLSFYGSDPGAVKYGNFINYYSFHSAKQRIDNLHPQMFPRTTETSILCLDIGCNTGELTTELHSYLKTIYSNVDIHMLAIDIDPTLINRAQETNTNSDISFQAINIMEETDCDVIHKYLKSHERKSFDVTFCFSVTMWIHLNNGDDGLKQFLQFIKDISKTIIMEPQPWHCYRNAQRRVKKSGNSFPLYEQLEIRSDVDIVIENILTQNSHRKNYESSASSWKRKVQSYQCS